MVYRAISYKTNLSAGLQSPLIVYILKPYLVFDLKFSNPVWNKNFNKCITSVLASSLMKVLLLDASQLHGSNSMTQQPQKLIIEYIYRQNSIYI